MADFQQLFVMYQNKQYAEAFPDLLKLAEQGNPYAQTLVGTMYEAGHGTAEDTDKAVYWYTLAANAGIGRAKNLLLNMTKR